MSVDALVSLAALEVACDEGVVAHLGRLEEALARAEGSDAAVLSAVRETLGIHLALLQRRPDALFGVLYAHAAFVDSPAARRFGLSRAGPEMDVHRQVHRWLEERRTLHPHRPWLRSLVPTTPWGGSLLSELRQLEGATVRRVTRDAVELEVKGAGWRWTPRSGALETCDLTPAPRVPLVHPEGGGLAVGRGGALQWLLEPPWRIGSIATSDDGRRIACHAEADDEAEIFVFELPSGRQLTSVEPSASTLALSPSGAFLAFRARGGPLLVHEIATGRQEGVASLGDVGALAVDDSGRWLAVAGERVVRLRQVHPAPWSAPVRRGLGPAFSRDGSGMLLGQYVLSGDDGSVRAVHAHRDGEYLEGGPAPNGVRLTRDRLCVSTPFATECLDLADGTTRALALHASLVHRVAWSGDGRVFARVRRHQQLVELASVDRQWTVDAQVPLEAIALDFTGSQLALLHADGTVQLQAGGTTLRRFPGATALAFLADDRALAVGGASATVVLGLDGSERWRSSDRFAANDGVCAEVEWRSGLRSPSIAEALHAKMADGLLTLSTGPRSAVFPSTSPSLLRSPSGGVLVNGLTPLKWEPE